MENKQASRNRAVSINPCLTVNAGMFSIYFSLTITLGGLSALPFNASVHA